jgi:hypothetical protein
VPSDKRQPDVEVAPRAGVGDLLQQLLAHRRGEVLEIARTSTNDRGPPVHAMQVIAVEDRPRWGTERVGAGRSLIGRPLMTMLSLERLVADLGDQAAVVVEPSPGDVEHLALRLVGAAAEQRMA